MRLFHWLILLLVAAMPFKASAFDIPPEWEGDVNLDGFIDISDVTVLIDGLLNNEITPTMDVNVDSIYDVEDVVALIYMIENYPKLVEQFDLYDCSFDMVYVRGGTFTMGGTAEQGSNATSHEKPTHQVTLASYYVARTEVTQGLWQAVMGYNPSQFKGFYLPVEGVTWEECQEFISRLSDLTGRPFRMLSEAEWEFAARGGRNSKGYVYAGGNALSTVGWYSGNSGNTTHNVGTKAANELDIRDMSGNVWEWCQDYWSDTYSAAAQTDPVGPLSGTNRVMRGGGWNSEAKACRVSNRQAGAPGFGSNNTGLRLGLDASSDSYLRLSRRVVCLEVGELKSVSIYNGSGNYTVTNNATDIVRCQVSGEQLNLTGLKVGSTTLVVKDSKTQQQATLTVIVYKNDVVIKPHTINGVDFNMVYVKGGIYKRGGTSEQGSDPFTNENPVHDVTLSSYSIGETEVTQALWQAVMGYNPSKFTGNLQRPVECVTWEECQEFIARLNELTGESFRLPTEAEWEYAARGGRLSKGYMYSGSNAIGNVAWYTANSSSTTHIVKTKMANELGIYDMSGNVSEWCSDWYGNYSSVGKLNPTGPGSGANRVSRGGNWSLAARYCRVSRRESRPVNTTVNMLGLRLAMDEPDSRLFSLSSHVIWMTVGEHRNVTILNGSGDYTIDNNNSQAVSYQLNGEMIELTGLKVGHANLYVTDNKTLARTHLTVIVSQPFNYHKDTYYIHGVPFNMVYVPQGIFTMGATTEQTAATSAEKPAHRVALSDYFIGETEVTQALWHAVMDYSPDVFNQEMKRPMVNVTWEDCQLFVARLSEITGLPFRLPTEAEWEFAARGGRRSMNYIYAGGNTIGNVAWYSGNSSSATHYVAQKAANELEIYDMSGNVAEWCLDWYGSYGSNPQFDPYGPDEGTARVVRGGAYNKAASSCRVSSRTSAGPTTANGSMGLRLALDFDNNYRLYLSRSVVYMEVGEYKSVKILNGLGDYTIDSKNEGVVDMTLNGEMIQLTATSAGKATFMIEDNTTHSRRQLTVIVTNPSHVEYRELKYKTISWWMMYVRDGAFDMGATPEQGNDPSDNERPAHRVALNDYYIGQTEVTQELWNAVMYNDWSDLGDDAKKPVEAVDWESCQEFVARLNEIFAEYDLNFRLPTEAEWEFAARGGNRSRGYKYSGSNTIGNVAWYQGNAQTPDDPYHQYGSRSVKSKSRNELGIYDMSGNALEWCQDWYGPYAAGGQFNPVGPATGTERVLRGGSYSSAALDCRVSVRSSMEPRWWSIPNGVGLRLAMDATSTHRFYLSPSVLRINVGDQADVNIMHGTGEYNITENNNGIVNYTLNGDKISVTGLKEGTASFVVTDTVSGEQSSLTVVVTEPAEQEHEHVDLGLPSGTLWATMNIGASSPEDYGDYFAWGETAPKDIYDSSTYRWCNVSDNMLTKYCTNSSDGTVDNKLELEYEDDAATTNWGSSWRMPSYAQIEELSNYCTNKWTTKNGVGGYLFTGPNGNTLFLPAAGFYFGSTLDGSDEIGCYWSRTLDLQFNGDAKSMVFYADNAGIYLNDGRKSGYSVRAVRTTEPVATAAPVITVDVQDDEVVITVTGDGIVSLFIDGEAVEDNRYVIARGPEDITVTAMATAQEAGKDMAITTRVVLIPAIIGNPAEEEFEVNGVTFKMVTVDGGTFTMGATGDLANDAYDWEYPTHQVTLSSYCIGETEVTQALWQAVMGNNPSTQTGNLQLPVDCVTWNDCQEFIIKLNALTGKQFRLPSEAEWEFAARGGTKSQGYIYSGSNTLDRVAWHKGNSNNLRHPVKTKNSNELGIYDMTGNVYEWCLDWLEYYSSSVQTNPVGPVTSTLVGDNGAYRVIRGGDWNSEPRYLRISDRLGVLPFYASGGNGMRLALDVDNSTKFRLSETVVTVEVGKSSTVNILNGNGSYTLAGSTDYFTSKISNNKLTVTGKAAGIAAVYVTNTSTGATAILTVIVTQPEGQEHEYVDLGLPSGTLWATMNIGASSPEGYGDYYAWGETEPKETYSWSNNKWSNGNWNSLTKYCTVSSHGTVDGKIELDPEDDAAYVNWGSSWRMPTWAQQDELFTECTWTWKTQNGVNGYLVTGPNGNSLFLPVAGNRGGSTLYNLGVRGYYWSRMLLYDGPNNVYSMSFDSQSKGWNYMTRDWGISVRAVRVLQEDQFALSKDVVTVEVGKSVTIDILNGNGSYSVNSNTNYVTSNISGNKLTVMGKAVGTVNVRVTNTSTGSVAFLTVIVTEAEGPAEEEFTVNGVTFKMVTVDGGTFTMGNNDNSNASPAHQVTLSTYKIGKTEVTQELWQAVMGNNPSYFKGSLQLPVETISWTDCLEFISKLNLLTGKKFRLPSEAEWEFAARGGNMSHGYEYAGSDSLETVAWDGDNSSYSTHAVATKLANELGIYDMNGNTYEWCQDCSVYSFDNNYDSNSQTNPVGGTTERYRVLRGGSWLPGFSGSVWSRFARYPRDKTSIFGLRLAMDLDNSSKFRLSETVVSLEVGESGSIDILNGSGNYTIVAGSDNVSASINGNRLTVTANTQGAATVFVTDTSSGFTTTLNVIINNIPAPFAFSESTVTVEVGEKKTVDVLNGTSPYYVLSMNGTNCASVSNNNDNTFTITGKSPGKSYVVYRDSNGDFASLIVIVTQASAPFALSMESLSMVVGMQKSVDILNGNGSYTVTGGSGIVTTTVSGNVLKVTGVTAGTATLTVKDNSTNATATLAVTVTDAVRGDVNCDGIIDENDYGELWYIYRGKTTLSTYSADVNANGSITFDYGSNILTSDNTALVEILYNDLMKSWNGYPFEDFDAISDIAVYMGYPVLKYDINGDGEISIADFNSILYGADEGLEPSIDSDPDLDNDGVVNWRDVCIFHVFWLKYNGFWQCEGTNQTTGEEAYMADGTPAMTGQATNDHMFVRMDYNGVTYDNSVNYDGASTQKVWFWLDDDEIYNNAKIQALTPCEYNSDGDLYNEITYNSLQMDIYLPNGFELTNGVNLFGRSAKFDWGARMPFESSVAISNQGTIVVDGVTYNIFRVLLSNYNGYGCHLSSNDGTEYKEHGALKKDDAPVFALFIKNNNSTGSLNHGEMILANLYLGFREGVVAGWIPNDYKFFYGTGGNNVTQLFLKYHRVKLHY